MTAITLCDPKQFSFDVESHTYRDAGGNAVPSVTTIIGAHWPINKSFYTNPGNTDRGTDMHDLTAMLEREEVTMADIPPVYKEPCAAWMEFLSSTGWDALAIEAPFICPSGYAGTIDRIYMGHNGPILVDLKTGAKAKWHAVQLAAYSLAVEELVDLKIGGHAIAHIDMTKNTVKLSTIDVTNAMAAWKGLMTWQKLKGR